MRSSLLVGLGMVISGCATTQPALDTATVTSAVTPRQAAQQIASLQGQVVHWGGKIISLSNRRDSTQVQILSYPLSSRGEPRTGGEPTGRFLFIHPGFLEPQDFRAGRTLSLVGSLRGSTTATVGDVTLVLPVVQADQLQLWPDRQRPRVVPHFGVGVSIGL